MVKKAFLIVLLLVLTNSVLAAECNDEGTECKIGQFVVTGEKLTVMTLQKRETEKETYISIQEAPFVISWKEHEKNIEKRFKDIRGMLSEEGVLEGKALNELWLKDIKLSKDAIFSYNLTTETIKIEEGTFMYKDIVYEATSDTEVSENKVKGRCSFKFGGQELKIDGEAVLMKNNILSLSKGTLLEIKDYDIIAYEDGTRVYLKKEKDIYSGPAVFVYGRSVVEEGKPQFVQEYRVSGKVGFGKSVGNRYSFVYSGKHADTEMVYLNYKDTDKIDISNDAAFDGTVGSIVFNVPKRETEREDILFIKSVEGLEAFFNRNINLPSSDTIVSIRTDKQTKQVFAYNIQTLSIHDEAGKLLAKKRLAEEFYKETFGMEKAKRLMNKYGCTAPSHLLEDYETELMRDRSYYDIINSLDTDRYMKSTVVGLIATESNFDARAKSRTNCAGLMQICPSQARAIGACDPRGCAYGDYRYQPDIAIKAGYTHLLGKMSTVKSSSTAKGDEFLMISIAAFNVGEGVIKKAIEATGKSSASFDEVMSKLTPQMIKENVAGLGTEELAKKRKKTLYCYVGKVMYVRSYFKDKFD